MAKIAEYRELDMSALQNTLRELEAEYFDLKFQAALSKLENVRLIRQKRHDIAKVKTVIKERNHKKVK
jgi:large subunit ribosomal protein L29